LAKSAGGPNLATILAMTIKGLPVRKGAGRTKRPTSRKEIYFITNDRASRRPVMRSAAGGVEKESGPHRPRQDHPRIRRPHARPARLPDSATSLAIVAAQNIGAPSRQIVQGCTGSPLQRKRRAGRD
jgi:hypothetical protein